MMRKKIIAGNWKMNKTPSEAYEFAKSMASSFDSEKAEVILCPPFVALQPVLEAVKGTHIQVGSQNMFHEDAGAYTGEISAKMLVDLGVSHVIIGHSERREYFGETDKTVNLKVKKALSSGLVPIICVGERLTEREQGITMELVRLQTKVAYEGLTAQDAEKTVIAYEPVWAIGTGKTATSAQAQEVCAEIRLAIASVFGQETADKIRILYGGSVNAANAKELFSMPDIDGGLVGGASLKAEFEQVIHF